MNKDLTAIELEERYKKNDILEDQYKACKGCPNNPANYELDDSYVTEMGGDNES